MTSFKERFYIKEIPKHKAIDMVKKHHYLHRAPPISYCFGLFDRDQILTEGVLEPTEKMIGCVTFGIPASHGLCAAICGEKHFRNVIELNRLFIFDGTPQNVESFLVSNSIQLLPEPYDIIVSYADRFEGHTGIIYQSTNFLYTGMSSETTEWELDGKAKHSRHLTDDMDMNTLKEFYGDRLKEGRKSRKHRYIFFKARGGKLKYYRKVLKWGILPYPKI
jgi:hypothetical protein